MWILLLWILLAPTHPLPATFIPPPLYLHAVLRAVFCCGDHVLGMFVSSAPERNRWRRSGGRVLMSWSEQRLVNETISSHVNDIKGPARRPGRRSIAATQRSAACAVLT